MCCCRRKATPPGSRARIGSSTLTHRSDHDAAVGARANKSSLVFLDGDETSANAKQRHLLGFGERRDAVVVPKRLEQLRATAEEVVRDDNAQRRAADDVGQHHVLKSVVGDDRPVRPARPARQIESVRRGPGRGGAVGRALGARKACGSPARAGAAQRRLLAAAIQTLGRRQRTRLPTRNAPRIEWRANTRISDCSTRIGTRPNTAGVGCTRLSRIRASERAAKRQQVGRAAVDGAHQPLSADHDRSTEADGVSRRSTRQPFEQPLQPRTAPASTTAAPTRGPAPLRPPRPASAWRAAVDHLAEHQRPPQRSAVRESARRSCCAVARCRGARPRRSAPRRRRGAACARWRRGCFR